MGSAARTKQPARKEEDPAQQVEYAANGNPDDSERKQKQSDDGIKH
jgi:hypothetical protein